MHKVVPLIEVFNISWISSTVDSSLVSFGPRRQYQLFDQQETAIL